MGIGYRRDETRARPKKYRAFLNNIVLANNVIFADTFLLKLVGLLRHRKLQNGEGLLLNHCKQVHTFGMKFNIDVIFLSNLGEVIYIENNMRPGRMSKYIRKAFAVLELKAGTAMENNISQNDQMKLEIQ